MISWRGVFPAVCTQFHDDYSLNVPGTLAHVDAMLDAGVHGLVMMGSVGENTALEAQEKKELFKAVVAHVRKRVPVLTGVAEYTTAEACRWAADAARLGVARVSYGTSLFRGEQTNLRQALARITAASSD